jgi:hypothetical protein
MPTPTPRSRRLFLGSRLALAGVAVWSAVALPASACGGLFCSRVPVEQTGEKIFFATDGQEITAHVQIAYQGDAKNFSWIVPVPSAPKLDVGSERFFTQLRTATRPQFELVVRDEGPCAPPMRYPSAPMGGASGVFKSERAKDKSAVTVVSQEQVGPYDTVVLQATDAGVLKAWLRKNDYVIPPKLDPLLDPYVAGKYSFVALKLTKDRAVGDIQPIIMTYKATKPGIPIRLTGIAAGNDMDINVWVLGQHRAVPENYRHARINESQIDWQQGGSNYKSVVTRAVDEAGGQAFVTDYAGPSGVIDRRRFHRAAYHLDTLASLHEPVAFAEAVVENGYFGENRFDVNPAALVAFLKKYIAKPKSLKDIDDRSFFNNIEQHQEALAEAGVKVDTERAIKELNETVVLPAEKIGKLFDRYHYLTAMYTTMSPAEMTQDPTFRFNPMLRHVAVVRHADGVRRCRPNLPYWQTPIEVTLSNGRRYWLPLDGRFSLMPGSSEGLSALQQTPAAEVIEQLSAVGEPAVIQDNGPAINQALTLAVQPGEPARGKWLAMLAGLLLLAGFGASRLRGR